MRAAIRSALNFVGIDVAASIRENFRVNFDSLLGKRGRQKELALALGVSTATVSLWRAGRRFPDGEHLEGIVKFFDVEPHDLFKDPGLLKAEKSKLTKEEQAAVREYRKALEAMRQFARMTGHELVKKN